jgi:hypothetical protein
MHTQSAALSRALALQEKVLKKLAAKRPTRSLVVTTKVHSEDL